MYSEKLEGLIDAVIADGEIEEAEMAVLKKAAEKEGEDPDEVEIVVRGRLAKAKKAEAATVQVKPASAPAPQMNLMQCPNCGAQVARGKTFCPECGHSFSEHRKTSAERLAEKLWVVGSEQEALNRREQFARERDANVYRLFAKDKKKSAVKSFFSDDDEYKQTSNSENKDLKAVCIENFPVPGDREDLLDFMKNILPKAKKPTFFSKNDPDKQVPHAYWKLYTNCLERARANFRNDPAFATFFVEEEEKKEQSDMIKGAFKSFFKL